MISKHTYTFPDTHGGMKLLVEEKLGPKQSSDTSSTLPYNVAATTNYGGPYNVAATTIYGGKSTNPQFWAAAAGATYQRRQEIIRKQQKKAQIEAYIRNFPKLF